MCQHYDETCIAGIDGLTCLTSARHFGGERGNLENKEELYTNPKENCSLVSR